MSNGETHGAASATTKGTDGALAEMNAEATLRKWERLRAEPGAGAAERVVLDAVIADLRRLAGWLGVDVEAVALDTRCQAKRADGERCRRRIVPDETLCAYHRGTNASS